MGGSLGRSSGDQVDPRPPGLGEIELLDRLLGGGKARRAGQRLAEDSRGLPLPFGLALERHRRPGALALPHHHELSAVLPRTFIPIDMRVEGGGLEAFFLRRFLRGLHRDRHLGTLLRLWKEGELVLPLSLDVEVGRGRGLVPGRRGDVLLELADVEELGDLEVTIRRWWGSLCRLGDDLHGPVG
jgi:hypothetical protein